MLLCCDIINLVKKASRDLKIEKSLTRTRPETTRSLSGGRFSVYNHSTQTKNDSYYETSTATKTAKVFGINPMELLRVIIQDQLQLRKLKLDLYLQESIKL